MNPRSIIQKKQTQSRIKPIFKITKSRIPSTAAISIRQRRMSSGIQHHPEDSGYFLMSYIMIL